METKEWKFSIRYFVATMMVLLVLQVVLLAPRAEALSYSEFKTLVTKGKVSNLLLDKQTITGTLASEGLEGLLPKEKLDELKRAGDGAHQFTVTRVDDPALVSELEAANIKFAGRLENTWLAALLSWVLPAVIFVGLWFVETARKIDAEIDQLLNAAHRRVRETLGKKRVILDALAKRLIEKEVVDRAALAQLIADAEPLPQAEAR